MHLAPIQEYITRYNDYVLSNSKTELLNEHRIRSTDTDYTNVYNKFLESRFLSPSITSTIQKNYTLIKTIQYTCKSPISTRQYTIHMTYYLPEHRMSHWNKNGFDLVEHYVKALFILFFYLEYIQSPCLKILNKPVEIHFCPTEIPKRIEQSTCRQKPFVFNPDIVNSGYTAFNGDGTSYIVIYRYEEFNRLLFHECIHYLGVDGDDSKWNEFVDVGEEFRSQHNIYGRINLFESYTDAWAIYWNILIYCHFNPSADSNTLWREEIAHQRKLIEYTMFCNGNKSIRDWMNNDRSTPSWKMNDTPSFDYYVLKHGAFHQGIDAIQRQFPFGKTTWNITAIRAWLKFCKDGLDGIDYSPMNHEKNKYVSTSMSHIGLKL